MHWVVLSANEERARRSADERRGVPRRCNELPGLGRGFRDAFFRYGGEVKEYFETLKERVSPDLILTHHGSDLHQDHRLVAELTWNTFRDHLILEYEIRSTTATSARPTSSSTWTRTRPGGRPRSCSTGFRPSGASVVHRRPVSRADAAARNGSRIAERLRRGVLRPKGRSGPFVNASSGTRDAPHEPRRSDMAELTQIETKIAEVIGLAQAARARPRRCPSSSRTAG